MAGLYVHIPFCANKCLYCDFYTGGVRIANWEIYIDCLLRELTLRKEELSETFDTLYIGGGTPSLIPSENFINLIRNIENITGIKSWKEFTIEVNPEDVTEEKIKIWKEEGVNRVSIGIQTFNDSELKSIGRKHDAGQANRAIEMLKKYFDNLSIDLMYGLPGQTVDSYLQTIEKALSFTPSHISSYSLMLEEGTAMTHLHELGKITLPTEKDWIEMSHFTNKIIEEAGYKRYEISNYALPGKESIHNTSYWEGKEYLGIGPGAHSYDGKHLRRFNPNDIKGYINRFKDSTKLNECFYSFEELTEEELREEMVMTRMRMAKGLSLKEFGEKFGEEAKNEFLQEAQSFIKSGCLQKKNGFISFTPKGYLISDTILSRLI